MSCDYGKKENSDRIKAVIMTNVWLSGDESPSVSCPNPDADSHETQREHCPVEGREFGKDLPCVLL
jgi:hypothetical protein